MKVVNMLKLFETALNTISDKFNDGEKPDRDEILTYLNSAQLTYMKEKYLNNATFKDNIESVNSRTEEFKNLIVNDTITSMSSYYMTHSISFNLPDNYLFYLKSDSKITRTTIYPCTNKYIPNQEGNYKDVDKLMTTPFNIPVIQRPLIVFMSVNDASGALLVHDKYTTISEIKISYVRKPKELIETVVDSDLQTDECELAEYVHNDIVNLALQLFEQNKFKLISKENKE